MYQARTKLACENSCSHGLWKIIHFGSYCLNQNGISTLPGTYLIMQQKGCHTYHTFFCLDRNYLRLDSVHIPVFVLHKLVVELVLFLSMRL